MDFEAILKQLQDWTNKVPLIILGSGASVPFGLPSMWRLGEYLKSTLSFDNEIDNTQLEAFKKGLEEFQDLEKTLLNIQLNENVLKEVIKATWMLISESDLSAYEQFVLNAKEVPLVILMKHLLSTTNRKLSVVTTNYDRIAEYCASASEAFICTGYSQNYIGHFSDNIHTNALAKIKGFGGQVNIWKVHGSLDWFETSSKENIHLPLRKDIPQDCKPLIVTPGLSKYAETHNEPYRTIFTQADTEIQNANGYLCIGYGFNDVHVQPKLIQQIKTKPIIVLTKELTSKTKETIIDGGCRNYILMEEINGKDTKIYSSSQGEHIIKNVSYWNLGEYLKRIQ
ncbi:SIR2 family protein [Sphingobacterium chungjuense]|uniref:SIR2 family protein n=1 Tax=Sphingobacterium chungjuense TaxID=2675553 RepID=UPI00140E0484|nr:SIR2 family protein [Sphingobacterium chungjuense]